MKAGHTQCAEALCEVLREKCEWNSSYSCSLNLVYYLLLSPW